MSQPPDKLIKLAEFIKKNGGRAMLVGGCVRDVLLGIEAKDFDVEIYGIEPQKLREILESLGKVDAVGEAFTVYKLGNNLDVSIPRREKKVSRGHKGFVVEGDPNMSFEEAAKRRDFTINAISRDVLTGEIIDVYDGREDIRRKRIRHVSDETFSEDSLRVLRAAQFAARFEFEIDEETVQLCRQIDLTDLPKERIWGELEKLLLKAEKPSIGLQKFYDLGVTEQLFPEMQALVGVPQQKEWHPEGDVDTHTLLVVDRARELINDLSYAKKVTVMLGAICHDFGKPATTEFFDGKWRSHAHDEAGVEPTISFLDKLGIYKINNFDVREQIVQLVRYHLKPGEFYKQRENLGDGAFRRLARKVEPDLLYRVSRADTLGRNADWMPKETWFDAVPQEWFIKRACELEVKNEAPKPILMGRHLQELGLKPSPRFGEITKAVYEMQLDGKVENLDAAISEAKKLIEKKELSTNLMNSEINLPKNKIRKTVILIGCVVVGTFLIYYFSNPKPQTYYDYTYRVAENFLRGAIGFTEKPPSWLNEFVPFENNWYSVFPLGSVLTMLPFALFKFFGIINDMPSAFISSLTASCICLLLLLIAREYDYGWSKRILLTFGILFGTWIWVNESMGSAWQLALGFAMVGELGAIYFTVFKPRPLLAGAFFALAFGNRTEVLLTAPIFMFLLAQTNVNHTDAAKYRTDQSIPQAENESANNSLSFTERFRSLINLLLSRWKTIVAFCAVPFVLGVLTLIYNYIRFHSPTDFGYARIPGVLEEPWYNHGIFSVYYIPGQAYEMLWKPWRVLENPPYLVPDPFSSSVLWSSPFLLLALRFGARDKILKYASWAAIFILTFLLWMHGNSGGWQFGYRYAMVLLPWIFLILLENSPKKITVLEGFLYIFSIAVNAYTVYLFHWTDKIKV